MLLCFGDWKPNNEMMKRNLMLFLLVGLICLATACKSKKENEHVQELVGYYEMNRVEVNGTGSQEIERGYVGSGSLDIVSFSDDNKISVRGSTEIDGKRYSLTVDAAVNSDGIIEFLPYECDTRVPNWARAFTRWKAHLSIVPQKSTLKLTNNVLSGLIVFEAYDIDREQYYSGRVIVSGYKIY